MSNSQLNPLQASKKQKIKKREHNMTKATLLQSEELKSQKTSGN